MIYFLTGTFLWDDWKTKIDHFKSPLVWWDKAKSHFKLISIRRAKIRGKLRRHECHQLEQQLERLQIKAQSGNTSDIERFLLVKEKLKQLDIRDLESTKIRVKARFMEDGEKSSRYFFSLEKQQKADHTIKVTTRDNMDTVTDPHDLLRETHDFYTNLYSAESCDESVRALFLDVDFPKLTEEARASCDDRLTEEELREALFSMENNKSPGVDGLSTNFYKHFWPLFSDRLLLVYNYAFDSGCLSVSQRRGIISLVFKKGDRTLLKNWRPITLLTTDYKILTKALANRLQRVMPLIVHTDQTASVKGRTINDNVRLLHDVIYYANYCDIPLAVITVDQLKAFDRVSHDFLFTVLDAFGFGPAFTQWIRVLYNSVSSSVLTNGWLTSFIGLRRGLRQGCALSMPLYVLTAEALAINIRANSKIHGLLPPGPTDVEVKLTQFADDTTLLLVDDDSIAEAFRTFDLYERASGAKINKHKCKGLWCGSFASWLDQPYGFEWFNDYIPDKVLGQFIGNVDCSRLNWEAKIKKLNNIIDAWCHRDLSFKGRALVINALLTSTLWYNATSLSVPAWASTRIEQIIYRFFWSNKHPLVNRDVLALPLSKGGFNIARLETKKRALRLNTLRRLLAWEHANWKYFTAFFLGVSGIRLGKLTPALNFNPQDIDHDLPPFHKELLSAWLKHKPFHSRLHIQESFPDILNEPLFRNNLSTAEGKPLFYKEWVKCGLIQLREICYEVIPGFLPLQAIHEILTRDDGQPDRPLRQTAREFTQVLNAIPQLWKIQLMQTQEEKPYSLQPRFSSIPSAPGNRLIDLGDHTTAMFYRQLLDTSIVPPALEFWRQTLQPQLSFNSAFWANVYPPLASNGLGDLNWKVTHRVLPTALSLYRIGVYATPRCHRCGQIENIEHVLTGCAATNPLWNQVQSYVDKITNSCLRITNHIKLLGWIPSNQKRMPQKVIDLVNWVLCVARFAIHKSAVNVRTRNETTPMVSIFRAFVKCRLNFQFNLHIMRDKLTEFQELWCLNSALARVEAQKLIFTL